MRSQAIPPKGKWICIVILTLAFIILPSWQVQAASPITVKIEVIMTGPPATILPAGDDENHLVGLGTRQGQATFSDGRTAKYSNVFTFDMVRGQSLETQGYTKMVFTDDSWLFFKWNGGVAGRDENGPLGRGTGRILKGTGPYQGITGEVSFSNRVLPPSREHPQGATLANAVMTYTLP